MFSATVVRTDWLAGQPSKRLMRVSRWTVLFLGVSIAAMGVPLRAQIDPQQLARDVAANELRAHQSFSPWIYTLRKNDGGRKEVLRVVNTKDGPLVRTISPQRAAAE